MSTIMLQTKLKSTGTAYLFWFLLGAHYAYLGKWGVQILYWITLGGLGLWALIDLFTMSGKVDNFNMPILHEIEKKERDEEHNRNMAMMAAASGNAQRQETTTV